MDNLLILLVPSPFFFFKKKLYQRVNSKFAFFSTLWDTKLPNFVHMWNCDLKENFRFIIVSIWHLVKVFPWIYSPYTTSGCGRRWSRFRRPCIFLQCLETAQLLLCRGSSSRCSPTSAQPLWLQKRTQDSNSDLLTAEHACSALPAPWASPKGCVNTWTP